MNTMQTTTAQIDEVTTVAERIYRITGQTDLRDALEFIKNRPLLSKVFERDFGESIDHWIYVYDECMIPEQKQQAEDMMFEAKQAVERAHSGQFYY